MPLFNRSARARSLAIVAALTPAGLASYPAAAADYDLGSIHIAAPWSRATPTAASSGAAYMTITNKGDKPDRVNCVSSDVSKTCQIHTMTMDNGVMQMRPVEGGLEIKPGETVALKPGGFHVMLMDLAHPLKQGDKVTLTLKFDNAGTIKVDYPIAAIGAAAPGAGGGGGMMMEGHGDHGGGMMMEGHGDHGGGMMPMNKH
jgi:periplasmic copper chaperone A